MDFSAGPEIYTQFYPRFCKEAVYDDLLSLPEQEGEAQPWQQNDLVDFISIFNLLILYTPLLTTEEPVCLIGSDRARPAYLPILYRFFPHVTFRALSDREEEDYPLFLIDLTQDAPLPSQGKIRLIRSSQVKPGVTMVFPTVAGDLFDLIFEEDLQADFEQTPIRFPDRTGPFCHPDGTPTPVSPFLPPFSYVSVVLYRLVSTYLATLASASTDITGDIPLFLQYIYQKLD